MATCTQCDKEFAGYRALNGHMNKHANEARKLVNNIVKIKGFYYGLYLEFDTAEDRAAGKHNGNVTAIYLDNGTFQSGGHTCYEAASGVFQHADSAVCSTSVGTDWLATLSQPIDEAQAREIHPTLFEYLDD